MEPFRLTNIDAATLSDIGLSRQRNEDRSRFLIPPPGVDQEALGALFVVADGMGGMGGGDVASQCTINELMRSYYTTQGIEVRNLLVRLKIALQAASDAVRAQAPALGLPRIGATAAGIIVTPAGDVLIFNVGDCRVYRIRAGHIQRVSHDQSVMEREIESGVSAERAAQETNSSLVTAYLGQPIPLEPELLADRAVARDIYIICSDGLWSLVKTEEIFNAVQTVPASAGVKNLVRLALQRGGQDNITAVIVRLGKAPLDLRKFAVVAAALLILLIGIVILLSILATGNKPPLPSTLTPATQSPSLVTQATPTKTNGQIQILPSDTPNNLSVP
jgi:serine/threonine protein phosphatase PrpC